MQHGRFGFILASCLAACGGPAEHAPATPEPSAAPPAPVEPAAPAAPPGPRAEAAGFVLEAVPPPALSVGTAGAVRIRLASRGGFHVNQEFPVSVELAGGTALGITKSQLARADAAEFDEAHFLFDAPLTPTGAGTQNLRATVNFAICTDENCLPQMAQLEVPVTVQ